MAIPLGDILADPSLAAGAPVLLAGASSLSTPVRWVHTSEVIEIASLLKGGELLLVGGVMLATATPTVRRDYVRSLASKQVAGLIIETGTRLATVPEEMVEEAENCGLALVELHEVVPFVAVTEAINGLLINQSVRQLQQGDKLSHTLAEALSDGASLDDLVAIIAKEIDADVELVSSSGALIASLSGDSERGNSPPVSASVTTAGVTVATLVMHPRPASDPMLLQVARDRAPAAISLALLRSRPLSHLERDARELLTIIRSGLRPTQRIADLAERLGLSAQGPHLGVFAQLGAHQLRESGIDEALRASGRKVISYLHEETYLAVVALGRGPRRLRRSEVLADLSKAKLPGGVRVVIGPGSRTLAGVGPFLSQAEACLTLGKSEPTDGLLDATDISVERLLLTLERSEAVSDFIDEQLGELFDLDTRKGGIMIDTLSSYLLHWGSKVETASALHLHRQSLYHRLDKIFEVLGNVPPGSPQLGSLMIAVELEAARRRTTQG